MKTTPRFEEVTETTGVPVSAEGARMIYTRYHVGAQMAAGRRVLEIGSAAGQGLGLIARSARLVVGGDYSDALLRSARAHYGSRIPLVRLSAERLPFPDAAFDLVLCFEASYYVPDMDAAFREMARVLSPRGTVLFVNANPERPDFISSPFSVHYHSGDEFRRALGALGMDVSIEGAFPTSSNQNLAGRIMGGVFGVARRGLEVAGLVPKTLAGRARLKRLVYGRLTPVPAELPEGFAEVEPRFPVGAGPVGGFKVLYVTGRRRD